MNNTFIPELVIEELDKFKMNNYFKKLDYVNIFKKASEIQ